MNSELVQDLILKAQAGGQAYIRNLAAAEAAVLAGQFNVAKVLRATAHSQRILAMDAARLLTGDFDAEKVLEANYKELDTEVIQDIFSHTTPNIASNVQVKIERYITVRSQLKDILSRALASLKDNSDVLESDVAQFIWGCYGCGYLVEGDRPEICPVCGALSIEFEGFGPFYSSTPEHLGQLSPVEIIATLATIPAQVEELIGNVDDKLLGEKPSEEEWCVKEIVGHIIETEGLFIQRIKYVLENQGIPVLPRPAPPWKLHEDKGYEDLTASELIERLKEIRNATIKLLASLEANQWMRQGVVQGNTVSMLDLGTWLTNHDRGHVAQIKRYIPTST